MVKLRLINQLKSYFNSNGIRFDIDEKRVWSFIEKIFGSERTIELDDIFTSDYNIGNLDPSKKYKFCKNYDEATTLMYFQSDFFLKNSEVIFEEILHYKPKKILELGCYTGVFANYIAEQFNKSKVLGIDKEINLIEFGKLRFKTHNLELINCEYKDLNMVNQKFDFIFTNFGIENIPSTKAIDSYKIRENNNYKIKFNYFCKFFEYLQSVSLEGAIFSCCARIPRSQTLLSFIDASHKFGWTWMSEKLNKISIYSETIPYLVFEKKKSNKMELTEFFQVTGDYFKQDDYRHAYNYEFNKSKFFNNLVRDTHTFTDTGDTLHFEVNTNNDLFNIFMWSTSGFINYKVSNNPQDIKDYFTEFTKGKLEF